MKAGYLKPGLVFVIIFLNHQCLIAASQVAGPQPPPPTRSSFDKGVTYKKLFTALNAQFSRNALALMQLVQQRDKIQSALADSALDLQRVNTLGVVSQMRVLESQIGLAMLRENAIQIVNADSEDLNANQRQLEMNLVTFRTIRQALEALRAQNQRLEIDAATQLTLERRRKLLISASDLMLRAQKWIGADRQLMDRYFDLMDIAGTRSTPELLAGLDALQQPKPENTGARLARAITLLRLKRSKEAEQVLNDFFAANSSFHPTAKAMALAIAGELLARRGESKKAKKAFGNAISEASSEPRIWWLCARGQAVMKNPDLSIRNWELLLASGKHDIAAHRGLALTYCTFWPKSQREQKLALEHAQLAHSLAGDDDWSCQIALALATAVSGDLPAGVQIAEEAAKNAADNNIATCLDIAAQLKGGTITAWQF